MTPVMLVGIGVAGGAGAVLRFVLDGRITARLRGAIPYGTFVVNLSGATMLGFVAGLVLTPILSLIIGTGAIGGYTTFSTWMFESQRLGEDSRSADAARNILYTLAAGLVCIAVGHALAGAV